MTEPRVVPRGVIPPVVEAQDAPIPLGHRAPGGADRPPASHAVGARPGAPAAPPLPSARDFTSERMLRPQLSPPRTGWRRIVFQATGGLVNFGPPPTELRELDFIARVKAPVSGCRRIAVVSRKGGVGKTTTTLMLGHTFASHRGDRVIAIDGNPDAGSLGYRVRRETTNTVMSLLAHRDQIVRYADIRAFTSQAPTRLEVVAADDDPRITDALREQDFFNALELLEVHYNLVFMDTGTGVLESASRGILRLADQLVVVTAPSLDSARTASSTLDWLDQNGHADLVAGAVAVINGVRGRGLVELDRVEAHFRARCRHVVRIPWDPHLEAGAESAVEQIKPATRGAYLELTASVADGFQDPKPAGGTR